MSLSGHGSLRGRCEPPHDGIGSAGLVMSTTRSIRAWRLMAATVPTRWPLPRPDEGRPSAAAGGSGGVAIGYSCRGDLLCRPAEFAAVAQHAMEDDRRRLVQVGAQQLVATAGDVAGVVRLAGLIAPRRQADVGPDAGRLGKALRRIHDAD